MNISARALLATVPVLIAACASAPGNGVEAPTAEQILGRIEKKINDAATIRADYAIEGIPFSKDARTLASASGTIEVKRGGKLRIEGETRLGKDSLKTGTLSDGKRYFGWVGDGAAVPEPTPKSMEASSRAWFSTLTLISVELLGTPQRSQDPREIFKVLRVSIGEDDGSLKTLRAEYQSNTPDAPNPTLRIWYDPRTLLIVKRTMTSSKLDVPIEITETFKDIKLDVDLPDDLFEVPE